MIPEPFPVVSGTYTGVVTYTEPSSGFSVRGNARIEVHQRGDQLTIRLDRRGDVSFPATAGWSGLSFSDIRASGTLTATGQARIEWVAESRPRNNTCGEYAGTTGSLTFSGSRMHYVQHFSSDSCGAAEISGTLTRQE